MDFELAPDVTNYKLHDQDTEDHMEAPTTTRAIVSGYLHKLAHSVLKTWHLRYYVLYSNGLLYSYHSDRSQSSHRIIPVGRLCLRLRFEKDTSKGDCRSWPKRVPVGQRFSIINSDRSYHFYTESHTELSKWKHHLQSTLHRLSSPSQALLDDIAAAETTPNEHKAISDDSYSSSSSEGSVEYTHNTKSIVKDMVEETFGEITTFLH